MAVDLKRYFARIGWDGGHRELAPDAFRALHRAHVQGIPFENVDPVLGTTPALSPEALQAKLVDDRRGGYCFEQNMLFAAVLEELGCTVVRHAARVRVGAEPGAVRPRTHMALAVTLPGGGGPWLADVGFGAVTALVEPLPLREGAEWAAGGRRHRVAVEPAGDGLLPLYVLRARTAEGWRDQFAFTREPMEAIDVEVANWYVATNPRSPFARSLYVQRALPDGGHLLLSGRTLTETAPDGSKTEREPAGAGELVRLLESRFGIALPPGTRLPSD